MARGKRIREVARFAVAAAFVALGLLLIAAAGQTRAATSDPTGSTCPDGYHWERLSGVGCVQNNLPPNARYSYTSAAICNDGFIGVHEPGPNDYGADPNASYLVACLTQAELDARNAATPTPAANGNGGGPALGAGPLDKLASGLIEEGVSQPNPADADLGGLAATGVLLLSVGGAVAAGGGSGMSGALGSLGGGHGTVARGAGSSASGQGRAGRPGAGAGTVTAGAASAAGFPGLASGAGAVVTSGFRLPLPRVELVQGGLSIFRSMKRVTEDANPTGYSPSEVALLLGDAAGISAVANALSPAIGLISLTASGAATATTVRSPGQIFDLLRRNFARLGYLQGIVDENVGHLDGELGELDARIDPASMPPAPADPAALPDSALAAARTGWAHRMDAVFDAVAAAQARLDDLDVRRGNLAHQIDALGDLLGRTDAAGSRPLTPDMASIVAYGRGWYFGGDSSKMAAALRESSSPSKGGATQRRMRAGGMDVALGLGGGPAPAGTNTLGSWATANGIHDGRLALVQAMAGLERWRGFYDALAGSAQEQLAVLRGQADRASAARRDLAAEVSRRAIGGFGR